MFQHNYDSEDLCYGYSEKFGDFILSSKKFNVSYTLAGDFAVIFKDHLELIYRKQDETLNKRIERLININLYYCIGTVIDEANQKLSHNTK